MMDTFEINYSCGHTIHSPIPPANYKWGQKGQNMREQLFKMMGVNSVEEYIELARTSCKDALCPQCSPSHDDDECHCD